MRKLGLVLTLAGGLALGATVTPSGAVEVLNWTWPLTKEPNHSADDCKRQGGLVVRKAGGQDVCNIPQSASPGTSSGPAKMQDLHFTQHGMAAPSSSAPANPK